MDVVVAGEVVTLLPERAMRWRGTTFVADVHLGKAEVFQRRGIPVPPGDLAADLARLGAIAGDRLVVLGDLIHGALAESVIDTVSRWRERVRVPILLVRGNHDRHDVLPDAWGIEEMAELRDGPFVFRHAPEPAVPYVWAGHLHPAVTLRGRADAVRAPAFHIGERVGVLPAFGSFTGGISLPRAPRDRVFAAFGTAVVPSRPWMDSRR